MCDPWLNQFWCRRKSEDFFLTSSTCSCSRFRSATSQSLSRSTSWSERKRKPVGRRKRRPRPRRGRSRATLRGNKRRRSRQSDCQVVASRYLSPILTALASSCSFAFRNGFCVQLPFVVNCARNPSWARVCLWSSTKLLKSFFTSERGRPNMSIRC